MALAKSQRSLKAWGKQKWSTKSGKKSSETGERYLPEKAIKAMSSAEYARSTAKKRKDKAKLVFLNQLSKGPLNKSAYLNRKEIDLIRSNSDNFGILVVSKT